MKASFWDFFSTSDMAYPRDPRSTNFDAREVSLLLSLVDDNKNVIENKATDGITSREKNEAWVSLAKTFNCASQGNERDVKQLRSKWTNSKKDARAYNAKQKKQKYITGGGKRMFQLNDTLEKIVSIIGPSATGYENPYDNDSEFSKKTKNDNVTKTVGSILSADDMQCSRQADDNIIFEHLHKSSEIYDWKQWSKDKSKNKLSPPIQATIDKITSLHKTKVLAIQPDGSKMIINNIRPVAELNLKKKRITERDLEIINKNKNPCETITSIAQNSNHVLSTGPIISTSKSGINKQESTAQDVSFPLISMQLKKEALQLKKEALQLKKEEFQLKKEEFEYHLAQSKNNSTIFND